MFLIPSKLFGIQFGYFPHILANPSYSIVVSNKLCLETRFTVFIFVLVFLCCCSKIPKQVQTCHMLFLAAKD